MTLGRSIGWFGRLALDRERASPSPKKAAQRTNWNVGICQPAPYGEVHVSLERFVAPPLRVHIRTSQKHGERGGTQRYEAGGIAVINSISTGFNDPPNIIASCVQERLGSVEYLPDETPLSLEQLDRITKKIASALKGSQTMMKKLGPPVKMK